MGSDDPRIQSGRLTFQFTKSEGNILDERIAKPATQAGLFVFQTYTILFVRHYSMRFSGNPGRTLCRLRGNLRRRASPQSMGIHVLEALTGTAAKRTLTMSAARLLAVKRDKICGPTIAGKCRNGGACRFWMLASAAVCCCSSV